MRLVTLGTSCAQQTLTRTQSAHAIVISPSVTYLFDCGSSTATTLMLAGIKQNTIHKVFITHLHTDHVIGLTGLLTDILGGHGGRVEDCKNGVKRDGGSRRILDIYGPCGTKEFLRTTFRLTYTMLAHSFRVHELLFEDDSIYSSEAYVGEEGSRDIRIGSDHAWSDISNDDKCSVLAVPIKHSVPCLGYVLKEHHMTSIPKEMIINLRGHYKPGTSGYSDAIAKLKAGEAVTMEGQTLGPLQREKGRQVVILGDTSDASAVLAHVEAPISLLLHESTNAYLPSYSKASDTLESVRERAIDRGHSTPEMAGELARRCESQILVLTHFSSRYSGADNVGALKVMKGFEKLASLAGSATQASVEALFDSSAHPDQKKQRTDGRGQHSESEAIQMYKGRVVAAWDGMFVDIPKTGIMLQ